MSFPKKPLVFIASSALAIGVAIPGAMALSGGGERPTLPAQVKSDDAKAQFKSSLGKLLGRFKGPGTTLVVRSCFWADAAKDGILREACAAAGGTFVDIGALGKDESNYARAERKFEHAGVAAHPGDKGMKAIADALLAALRAPAK